MSIKITLPIILASTIFVTGCSPEKEPLGEVAPVIGDAALRFWNADDSYFNSADAFLKAYFQVTDQNGLDTIDYVSVQFGDDNPVIMIEDGGVIENNSSTAGYFSTTNYYNGSTPDSRPISALITARDTSGLETTKTVTLVKPNMTAMDSETFIYTEDYAGSDTINGVYGLKKPSLATATATATTVSLTGINTNDINADVVKFWFYDAADNFIGSSELENGNFSHHVDNAKTLQISDIDFEDTYSITDISTVYPFTFSATWNDDSSYANYRPYMANGPSVTVP